MSEQKTYTGSCQCGAVKIKVTGEFERGVTCNCSLCGRVGHVLTFVPSSQFELVEGKDALTDYQFGKKRLHHPFCSRCGVRVFSYGKSPKGGDMTAINLRCLDDFDVSAIPQQAFDGKSLPVD